MKYAMLVYGDDSAWVDLSNEEKAELRAQEMPRWLALFDELQKADPNLTGYELDARRNGEGRPRAGRRADRHRRPVHRDEGGRRRGLRRRPPDLDEAIRLASMIPTAEHGSLEIRPLIE